MQPVVISEVGFPFADRDRGVIHVGGNFSSLVGRCYELSEGRLQLRDNLNFGIVQGEF